MSEPIQSISQGNYILHNIDAKKLYVQEPLFTANSGDAVYVGWRPDETVLWSGSSALSANPTITLLESYYNFEYVRIYVKGYPSTQAILAGEADAQNSYNDNVVTTWMTVPCGGANGGALRLNQFAYSANENTFKVSMAKQFNLQGTAASTAACPSIITKIVGVNRLSGGNA